MSTRLSTSNAFDINKYIPSKELYDEQLWVRQNVTSTSMSGQCLAGGSFSYNAMYNSNVNDINDNTNPNYFLIDRNFKKSFVFFFNKKVH